MQRSALTFKDLPRESEGNPNGNPVRLCMGTLGGWNQIP